MCARCRNEGGDIDFETLPKRKKKAKPVLVSAYIPTAEDERQALDIVEPPAAPADTSYVMQPVVIEIEEVVSGDGKDVMLAPAAKSSLPKRKRKGRPVVISAYMATEEEERLALEMDKQVESASQTDSLSDGNHLKNRNEPFEAATASTHLETPVNVESSLLEPTIDSTINDAPPLSEVYTEDSALINRTPCAMLLYWSSIVHLCKPYMMKLPMLRVSFKLFTTLLGGVLDWSAVNEIFKTLNIVQK